MTESVVVPETKQIVAFSFARLTLAPLGQIIGHGCMSRAEPACEAVIGHLGFK